MNTIIEAKIKVDVLSAEGTALFSGPYTHEEGQDFFQRMADARSALEEAQANLAPATDANGNDIWNLWASLPARRMDSVTVTTDSHANRSAIGNFLLDEGYTVYTD
jgi:hypothetical protein